MRARAQINEEASRVPRRGRAAGRAGGGRPGGRGGLDQVDSEASLDPGDLSRRVDAEDGRQAKLILEGHCCVLAAEPSSG